MDGRGGYRKVDGRVEIEMRDPTKASGADVPRAARPRS